MDASSQDASNVDSATPRDSGTDAGVDATTDSGSDAGSSACAAEAASRCNMLATCEPKILMLAYENETICNQVITQQCSDNAAKGDNGVIDEAACDAALSASCSAYFDGLLVPPAACLRKTGNVPDQGKCFFDSQCTTGEYCYYNAGCGVCQAATQAGSACNVDHDCDYDKGFRCAATFIAGTPPSSDGNNVCQKVTFGTSGAACIDGTNQRCASGFACNAASNQCDQVLPTGTPCDGASATLCDSRIGDSCQLDPQNPAAHVCTAIRVAPIGGQCGLFGTPAIFQLCSSYAICSGSTAPMVCAARVPKGMPCTSAPDNCDPGLTCVANACTPPAPTVCP
jgi:hypothetical protein